MGNLKLNEIRVLYHKCEKIRPWVISEMGYVPEYMRVVRQVYEDGGVLNDQVIFQIVRDVYKELYRQGNGYKKARDVVNKISKDVYGDPHAWQYK